MTKDKDTEAADERAAAGKLADPTKANQGDVEDDRTRILNEAQEAHVRDFSAEARDKALAQSEAEDEVDQYHKGGGWYELPNGETVQGRDAAIEALGSR